MKRHESRTLEWFIILQFWTMQIPSYHRCNEVKRTTVDYSPRTSISIFKCLCSQITRTYPALLACLHSQISSREKGRFCSAFERVHEFGILGSEIFPNFSGCRLLTVDFKSCSSLFCLFASVCIASRAVWRLGIQNQPGKFQGWCTPYLRTRADWRSSGCLQLKRIVQSDPRRAG